MNVVVINRAGYTETEQDVIRSSGSWYVVQQLETGGGESGPVWHAGPAKGAAEAEQLALGLSELFPDRVAAAVGVPYGAASDWPLIVACVPDGVEFPGERDDQLAELVSAAWGVHSKTFGGPKSMRSNLTAAAPPADAGAAQAGPDLGDHLYQNKQAFPQHQRGDGTPAGELASNDGGRQLDPRADRQALGELPGGGEGGAP